MQGRGEGRKSNPWLAVTSLWLWKEEHESWWQLGVSTMGVISVSRASPPWNIHSLPLNVLCVLAIQIKNSRWLGDMSEHYMIQEEFTHFFQFSPYLSLSSLRIRFWNKDLSMNSLPVKWSQEKLVAVWASETGKGRQPDQGFMTKQVTTVGIWSLTPLGNPRSRVGLAPQNTLTPKVRRAEVFIH